MPEPVEGDPEVVRMLGSGGGVPVDDEPWESEPAEVPEVVVELPGIVYVMTIGVEAGPRVVSVVKVTTVEDCPELQGSV